MKLLPSSAQDLMKNRLTHFVKNFDLKDETSLDLTVDKTSKIKQSENGFDEDLPDIEDDLDDFKDLKDRLPLPEGVL